MADCTNKKQVAVVLQWIDDALTVHEDFTGMYEVDSIEAKVLVTILQDILLQANLSMHKIRGQCYDGASTMPGVRNGVAKQIMDKEAKALYTHCYGHTLSLASMDAIKGSLIMKRALEYTREITQLIKFSSRRDAIFQKLKSELSPESLGIRDLSPARWTVRADVLASIVSNYSVLRELWEECCARCRSLTTDVLLKSAPSRINVSYHSS